MEFVRPAIASALVIALASLLGPTALIVVMGGLFLAANLVAVWRVVGHSHDETPWDTTIAAVAVASGLMILIHLAIESLPVI